MRWIAINRHQNNLIVTDSCSVLQAIQSRTFGKHYILSKILLLHHYLTVSNLTIHFLWVPSHSGTIHFLWVPSHSGILGNETADCLTESLFRSNNLVAETGVQTTEIANKLSHSEVKSTIRDHCLEKWNQKYILLRAVNINGYFLAFIQNQTIKIISFFGSKLVIVG